MRFRAIGYPQPEKMGYQVQILRGGEWVVAAYCNTRLEMTETLAAMGGESARRRGVDVRGVEVAA